MSGAPTAADFWPAFVIVGAISASATLVYLGLPVSAGSDIAGPKLRTARKPAKAGPAGAAED